MLLDAARNACKWISFRKCHSIGWFRLIESIHIPKNFFELELPQSLSLMPYWIPHILNSSRHAVHTLALRLHSIFGQLFSDDSNVLSVRNCFTHYSCPTVSDPTTVASLHHRLFYRLSNGMNARHKSMPRYQCSMHILRLHSTHQCIYTNVYIPMRRCTLYSEEFKPISANTRYIKYNKQCGWKDSECRMMIDDKI